MRSIEIEVQFGPGNRIVRSFPEGTTIGEIVNDDTVKSALGHPANVRPLIRRVPQDANTRAVQGDVIVLETVGTSKAGAQDLR